MLAEFGLNLSDKEHGGVREYPFFLSFIALSISPIILLAGSIPSKVLIKVLPSLLEQLAEQYSAAQYLLTSPGNFSASLNTPRPKPGTQRPRIRRSLKLTL
jgi:hypothetical protein